MNMASGGEENKRLFRDLDAEEDEQELTELESLCLNCGKNGFTRLMLTKIPHYKEIIIMSFNCPHCGLSNNETQFGGKFQEKGVKIRLQVKSKEDLNRQVVKSDFCTVLVPELELEIPAKSRKGEVTTVEGIIHRVTAGLKQDQDARKLQDPESAEKIEAFIKTLTETLNLNNPFHVELADPSGNSYIESLTAPSIDSQLKIVKYDRSREDDELIGNVAANSDSSERGDTFESSIVKDEVLSFATSCYNCNSPCETNMKTINIPHFKEAVIMATSCESCGLRTNEVKSGAGIEPKGIRLTLNMKNPSYFNRDVLKSETCSVLIPELDLEIGPRTFGGRFTTVEGLLNNIFDQLKEQNLLFLGDAANPDRQQKMADFLKQLNEVKLGKRPVHVILDDPAGNSYLENPYAPDSDPDLEVVYYERSFDQNEELGLNDMKTENYENDS